MSTLYLKGTILILAFTFILQTVHGFQSEKKVLQLDSYTTRPDYSREGVFQLEGDDLYYLNTISNEIKVFNFQDGSTIRTIKLATSGPNSVGPKPYIFHLINKDSILVFSDFYDQSMALINGEGQLLEKFNLATTSERSLELRGTITDGNHGIAVVGKKAYVGKVCYSYKTLKEIPPLLEVDLSTATNRTFKEPKEYSNGMLDRVPTIDQVIAPNILHNKKAGTLVLSYPLDHNLYVSSDGFATYQTVKAQSNHDGGFHLLTKHYKNLSPQELREQGSATMRLSVQYLNLLYNEDMDQYYRIVRVPFDEKEYRNYKKGLIARMPAPDYAVIKLDSQFKIVSEHKFSLKNHRLDLGLFVSPEGLWALSPESDNENVMEFELLNLN